jgi:hypothetical protein
MDTGRAPEVTPGARPVRRVLLPLVVVTVLGALLRIAHQVDRPFVGDDQGTLHYLDSSYGFLLTTFDIWVTMNYFMVLLKALRDAFGDSPWVLVAPCLAVGVATIPVVHRLARRYLDERTALIPPLFLAVSPLMIEFSASLRSYMLLVCFSLVALLAMLRWTDAPGWRRGIVCAVWAAVAMIAHPNALYPLSFLGVLLLLHLRSSREHLATLLAPLAAAALVVVLAYLPLRAGMASYRADWTVPPPSDWGYLPTMARRYFGGGWSAVPSLLLFGVGLWAAIRERAPLAVLGLGILAPLCVASLLGVSTIVGAYARFLSPILPLVFLFVAKGIATIANGTSRARAVGAVLTLLVVVSWVPRWQRSHDTKHAAPYAAIAAHLETLDPARSEVHCLDVSTRRFLVPYLGKEPFGSLARWLRASEGRTAPRLIVVADGPDLADDAEVFGDVQVLTYAESDQRAVLQALQADLERTLADRPVEPAYTDHYGALMSVLMALGRDAEVVEFTVYYYECFLRSQRLRDVPRQLLDVRDSMSKHPLVKQVLGQDD